MGKLSVRKLHKLMYYAQCYSLALDGKPLFDAPILARECGPYVEILDRYTAGYYADPLISSVTDDQSLLSKSTYFRNEANREQRVIDAVLENYGTKSDYDIINDSKQSAPYLRVKDDNPRSVISQDSMMRYGKELLNGSQITIPSYKEYDPSTDEYVWMLRQAKKELEAGL